MTAKIIARLESDGHCSTLGDITLEHDGVTHKLIHVTELRADSDGNFEVKMWADAFEAEVVVSALTAEAVLRVDSTKRLSFLSDHDSKALKALRGLLEHVTAPPEYSDPPDVLQEGRAALDKIIVELLRREDIPF